MTLFFSSIFFLEFYYHFSSSPILVCLLWTASSLLGFYWFLWFCREAFVISSLNDYIIFLSYLIHLLWIFFFKSYLSLDKSHTFWRSYELKDGGWGKLREWARTAGHSELGILSQNTCFPTVLFSLFSLRGEISFLDGNSAFVYCRRFLL